MSPQEKVNCVVVDIHCFLHRKVHVGKALESNLKQLL